MHRYNTFTQWETDCYLSFLMLVLVESFEALEFWVELHWKSDYHLFVSWPICSLEALEGTCYSVNFCIIALKFLEMSFIFLSLLFYYAEVLQHTLKFVDLLHTTSNFEIWDEKSFKVYVLWFLGKKPSCEDVPMNHQEKILVYEVWKETDYVF